MHLKTYAVKGEDENGRHFSTHCKDIHQCPENSITTNSKLPDLCVSGKLSHGLDTLGSNVSQM